MPNQYLIPAAIGNPPQPVRLLVDLTWDTLWVTSVDCDDCNDYDPDRLPFQANLSSTYCQKDHDAEMVYALDRIFGELATDTFQIAGLEVSQQPFVNADEINALGFIDFYFGYDGVLGLAPRFNHLQTTYPTRAPSPWFNMVNQSMLDANLFALELPRGLQDWIGLNRWGEISFGGISPKYASANFSSLSLSEYSDQVWAVEAQSVTWHNETHPLHEDFTNLTLAGFDTTAWFIGLPGNWSQEIYASVEHQCGGFSLFCEIDCLQRRHMPDLTLGIGGHNFTIGPYDYAPEFEGPGKMRMCTFDIFPTEDQFPVDAIVLGKGFMEAFYR